MAHNYKSDCQTCYRHQQCKDELYNLELTDKRIAEAKNQPFTKYNPGSRAHYVKWWRVNGMPMGMSNHDCYKSQKQHRLDIENAKKSQEKERSE